MVKKSIIIGRQTFKFLSQQLKKILLFSVLLMFFCQGIICQNRDNGFGQPPVPPIDGAKALVVKGIWPSPPSTSPVTYDQHSFKINGQRVLLTSGEFHYWRLPAPGQWKRVFEIMRAGGLNTVSFYLNWAYHSPSPGVYDFTGIRNLDRFLRDAEEAGLYVIVRAGPAIYSETNGMGYPGWLNGTTATYRSLDPAFLTAVQQWYNAALPIVARHQLHKGGKVIMVQLDNEIVNGDPAYLTALYRMARQSGIEVPLFHDPSGSQGTYTRVVDFEAYNAYPATLDCTHAWSMSDLSGSEKFEKNLRENTANAPFPIMMSEFQGGSMDNYGGTGYQTCYNNLTPSFVDAFTRTFLSQGATALNWYMFYGGTSWGYLPDNLTYTSYDYGAPVREFLGIGPRYLATKRNMFFMRAVEEQFSATNATAAAVSSSNPDLLLNSRVNIETGSGFIFLRNNDESKPQSTTLDINFRNEKLHVPQKGGIQLEPRETRVLIANYPTSWGSITYTTSQLLTNAMQGNQDTWIFYSKKGTAGETMLEIKDVTGVEKSAGVTVSGTADKKLISYKHGTVPVYARLKFSKGSLLLVFADEAFADQTWRFPLAGGDVLAHANGFVGMPDDKGNIRIETSGPQAVTMFGGSLPMNFQLDGQAVKVENMPVSNAFRFMVSGKQTQIENASSVELKDWSFRSEPFEGNLQFDDSKWAAVDRYRSLNPDMHDYHYGFVWNRGRFVASGKEQAVRITQTECYGLWLNGSFIGSASWVDSNWSPRKPDPKSHVFTIPAGLLKSGSDNIMALLTEDAGKSRSAPKIELLEDTIKTALPVDISWKLIGADGAMRQTLLSPMNASGLYGERNGWYKTDLNDNSSNWQNITIPHKFREPQSWVGWYRTNLELHVPANINAPMAIVMDKAIESPDKAIIFVNGYNMGRYMPERGPQTRFFVPDGILNKDGKNTIVIAVWRRSTETGGLGIVRLEPYETTTLSILHAK